MEVLFKLPDNALNTIEYGVIWIGFSAVVGMIASFILLRRRGLPTAMTILLGYIGTIAGWSMAKVYTSATGNFQGDWKQQLLSPATFLIGIAGTVGLLFVVNMISKQSGQGQGSAPASSGDPSRK